MHGIAVKSFRPLEDVDSVLSILARISLLGGISEEQRDLVFRRFEVATYEANECVSRQGAEASHLYIVRQGKVELCISDGERRFSKRQFDIGDSFGEAAMLSLVNNTASFIATESTELIVLSRWSLNQLRVESPDIFCQLILNLARDLARKLQYSDELLLRSSTPVS